MGAREADTPCNTCHDADTRELAVAIDDTAFALTVEKAMLHSFFPTAEVHGFSSPRKALDFFERLMRDNAQLSRTVLRIISDFNMPGMNGVELLNALFDLGLATHRQLHVVLLTANPDQVTGLKGACEVLAKGTSPVIIQAALT